MIRHEQIISFLATLAALLIVYVTTLLVVAHYPEILGKVETFGLGTITGGLIGILRIPSQRAPGDATSTQEPGPGT